MVAYQQFVAYHSLDNASFVQLGGLTSGHEARYVEYFGAMENDGKIWPESEMLKELKPYMTFHYNPL